MRGHQIAARLRAFLEEEGDFATVLRGAMTFSIYSLSSAIYKRRFRCGRSAFRHVACMQIFAEKLSVALADQRQRQPIVTV